VVIIDIGINNGIIFLRNKRISKLYEKIRQNPQDVQFGDLCRLCDHIFGPARQQGTSHRVYKTPWKGDPRVNIQNFHGKAKVYQVRQVLKAIQKMGKGDTESF